MSDPSLQEQIDKVRQDKNLNHDTIYQCVAQLGPSPVVDPILYVYMTKGVRMGYDSDDLNIAFRLHLTDGERTVVAIPEKELGYTVMDKTITVGTFLRLKDYTCEMEPRKKDPTKHTRYLSLKDVEIVTFDEEGRETSSTRVEPQMAEPAHLQSQAEPTTPRKLLQPRSKAQSKDEKHK